MSADLIAAFAAGVLIALLAGFGLGLSMREWWNE